MKKTIGLSLAALLCLLGGFTAVEGSNQPIVSEEATKEGDSYLLGRDAVSQIRKDYSEGRFDSFLKDSNAAYEQVLETGKISDLSSLREGFTFNPKWRESVKAVQAEKNTELLRAIQGQDSLFSEKVRSATYSNPQLDDALHLLSKFHHMTPGTGANADENKIIDLDLEYEYKAIHLDMPVKDSNLAQQIRSQQFALKMEQMDKLLLASQSFNDVALKEAITVVSKNLDEHLAHSWDLMDLHMLAKEQRKPSDSSEESVVAILKMTQEKLSDLAKNF